MELDWTTFLLEIINFLVLVWLLKRFLYRPVIGIIEQRRSRIEANLAEAQSLKEEANGLREQYEGRLVTWNEERERAAQALAREIDTDRAKRRAELDIELEREREKSAAAVALREADARLRLEASALEQGAAFAARLLTDVASEALEARLIELSLAELEALSGERTSALRAHLAKEADVTVTSAYALSEPRRERIREVLATVIEPMRSLCFDRDETLLAGLEIKIGAWSLGLNLRDELDGFTRLDRDR